jgi:hypothetical protein
MIADLAHGRVAKPALRYVDDALEFEVVRRIVDDFQIGNRVLDLLTLVEARAANHAVRQTKRDEAVLDRAHLIRGTNQDRDLVELVALSLVVLDVLADRAGFFLVVPDAQNADLFAASSSVKSVLPRRLALCEMTPEAAARM